MRINGTKAGMERMTCCNRFPFNFFFSMLTLLLLHCLVFAGEQESGASAEGDSLKIFPVAVPVLHDTTLAAVADSTIADSLQQLSVATEDSDIDTIIYYKARVIKTSADESKTILFDNAEISYKNMKLKAGKIILDRDSTLVTAVPIPDSLMAASDSSGQDSTRKKSKLVQYPVLVDGGTELMGEKMIYNYKTEKAIVVRGRSQFENGFYNGVQIKRVDKKTLNVSHGNFTTCDRDSAPHYFFQARRIKVLLNDKVIAKPIIFYISHIPLAALPYGIFPNKTGRQSGIIIPRYGESSREGRYLRGMGYYWAPSDYYDATAQADFFEKTGWLFHGGMNYQVRYKLRGTVRGSYTRKTFTDGFTQRKQRRWDLRVDHNHEIDRNTRFSIRATVLSDKGYYREVSPNLSTRLTRELRSDATYTKNWPKQKLSLSVNLSRVHDLEDDVTQEIIPRLNFRKGQSQIFKPEEEKGRRRGSRRRPEPKWYHSLYYSYSSSLLNKRSETLVETETDTLKKIETTRNMNHDINLSLNSPKKYFGWLSLNQSATFSEDWFDEINEYTLNTETNQFETSKKKQFAARHTFSYNASANTKLYGMFTPDIFDIQAIRHVVTPSLNFNYTPDFSDPVWGYYVEKTDTAGKVFEKDRFGGTPSGGSKSIGISVRNLFQMKRGYGEKEKKVDLFTMDLSTGFNFKRKDQRLSDLRTSWNANPAKNFSLSASTNHSFYALNEEGTRAINKYLFDDKGWQKGDIMRMTSLNLGFSFRLQGKSGKKKQNGAGDSKDFNTDGEMGMADMEDPSVLEDDLMRRADRFDPDRSFQSLDIPWRMSLRFNFNLNKTNPQNPVKRYYMDISGAEINLTQYWRIGYSAHYDLEKGTVAHHRMSFYRDLHCWEASIDWVPSGINKQVFFRINIKEPMLRDIKLEKGGGRGSSMMGYY